MKRKLVLFIGIILYGVQGVCAGSELLFLITSCLWPLCFLYAVCKTESTKHSWLLLPAVYIGTAFRFLFTMGYSALGILIMVLTSVMIAFLLFLVFFLYGIAYRKIRSPFVVILFPVLFVGCLLLFSQLIHLGNVVNPAASLISLKLISQSAALIGELGLSFVLFLIMAVVIYISDDRSRRVKIVLSSICGALVLFSIICGCIRILVAKDSTESIKVAGAMSLESEFTDMPGRYRPGEYIAAFERAIKDASDNNADILITNEEYAFFDEENFDSYMTQIAQCVRKYHIPTLFCAGTMHKTDKAELLDNKAFLFDENGEIVGEYNKHNRIFMLETLTVLKGDDVPKEAVITIKGKPRKVAVAICFDLNDELFIDRMSDDVEMILAPSWDWENVCYSQPMFTRFRAVEQGVTLIKPTFSGCFYASDKYGNIENSESTLNKFDQVIYLDVAL